MPQPDESETFVIFERDLQDALNHLYDPANPQPLEKLCGVLGCTPQASAAQQAIIAAIEGLKPPADTPPSARSWRFYQLLFYRYLRRMTQDETAEQLAITPRHLRREQSLAVEALAHTLWESRARVAAPEKSETTAQEYSNQVKAELSALQVNEGGQVARIAEAARSVAGLVSALTLRYGITLEIGEISASDSLAANLPPASLRQILVQTISELARSLNGGRSDYQGVIELEYSQTDGQVLLTMTGRSKTPAAHAATGLAIKDHLIRELLAVYNGTLDVSEEDQEIIISIRLPADLLSVLVVDDNPDLVHFYQRYAQGTRYRITAINEGSRIFETIASARPDIIVLDAMLPNVDGWELLSHLHAHPDTQDIPVVICSVVREEELALILGAAVYVAKPVRRQEFLQALDQAAERIP